MDNASMLSRRDMRLFPEPARKDVFSASGTKAGEPGLNRCSGLVSYLELDRSAGLLLNHGRSVLHPPADAYIVDLESHDIATPQLAVDRKIEQREVAFAPLQLQPDPYRPHVLGLQWALLADEAPLVPRIMRPGQQRIASVGHDRLLRAGHSLLSASRMAGKSFYLEVVPQRFC
jgi:hypothetical protein